MKLKIVLACCVVAASASAAQAREPSKVVGTWVREAAPGVAGFFQLTFTPDGRLMADRGALIGRYQVKAKQVSARSSFGETYLYELTGDDRLCVRPGPGMMPLAGEGGARLPASLCFSRA